MVDKPIVVERDEHRLARVLLNVSDLVEKGSVVGDVSRESLPLVRTRAYDENTIEPLRAACCG
jgi:hypothetical protein